MTQKIKYKRLDHFGFGPNVMKKLKVCPKCGSLAETNSVFCSKCGERLPDGSLFDVYKSLHKCCSVCDIVIPAGAAYCPNCGKEITNKKE